MSYGSGWGSGPWGDGPDAPSAATIDVTVNDAIAVTESSGFNIALRVAQAGAPSPFSVIVTFSNELDISYPPLIDPANYSIPGLTILGATVLDNFRVELTTTPAQQNILYTVTVTQAQSTNGDGLGADNFANFFGFIAIPTFLAGAASPTKVLVVFSTGMTIDSAFTTPGNYTVKRITGNAAVTVLSVTPFGGSPVRRAILELGTALVSKEYYSIVVSPTITDSVGVPVDPDTYIFQWGDMTQALHGGSVEVPIKDFSGEVSGGLLGQPDGLVFFSPALENSVASQSTIELETVSVCTTAFDQYTFPDPPDPPILFTFGGGTSSVVGPSCVLWAAPERLGLARMNLLDLHLEAVQPPYDGPAVGTLVEPIDITKASFLNDSRWKTFPGTIHFATASNLSPIGPGPTQVVHLEDPQIEVLDSFPITDTVTVVSAP